MMAPITKGLKAADVYVIVNAIAVSRAEPAASAAYSLSRPSDMAKPPLSVKDKATRINGGANVGTRAMATRLAEQPTTVAVKRVRRRWVRWEHAGKVSAAMMPEPVKMPKSSPAVSGV